MQDAVELARVRHHLSPESVAWDLDGRTAERLSVSGDREELSAVLSNVLDNAVKYSPKDPRIRVEVVTPDLQRVQIKVQDNGIGIPSSELKRVFKRFYRVLNTGATQVKGSGLGLFIVRASFNATAAKPGPKATAQARELPLLLNFPGFNDDRTHPDGGRRRAPGSGA